MMKSIFPFIAIFLFFLSLFLDKPLKEKTGALGWVFICIYSFFETTSYLKQGEGFDASISLLFLAFCLFFAFLMLRVKEKEDLFHTMTKLALITSVFYFPFSEIPTLNTSLIYITTKITSTMLNIFGVAVRMEYPSFIYYSAGADFHLFYPPVEIILACTAIQSMVLFMGLVFSVNAPIRRKIAAFIASVPVIYILNILRNMFVVSAYFGQWFGSPAQSFYIAHHYIARIGVMFSLIIIVYAVFIILPESLRLIEDLFRTVKKII